MSGKHLNGKREPRAAGRRLWASLHRWIGLVMGVVLCAVCISGVLITWKREILRLTDPALFASSAPGVQGVPPDAVLAAVRLRDDRPVRAVAPPNEVWPVWVVSVSAQGGFSAPMTNYMVDPADGRILGSDLPRQGFLAFMGQFHHNLLLRDWWGKEILGAIGVLTLFSALSGLYLWWPLRKKFWRSVSWRRGTPKARLLLDIHNSFGFWAMIPLVIFGFTAMTLGYREVTRTVVGVFSPLAAPLPSMMKMGSGPGQRQADQPLAAFSLAMAHAAQAFPGYEMTMILPPVMVGDPYRILMNPDFYRGSSRGRVTLLLAADDGHVIEQRTPATASAGDLFLAEQVWLHYGLSFGTLGRVLASLAGLVPVVLMVSGLWMWARKAALRRQKRRKNVGVAVGAGEASRV